MQLLALREDKVCLSFLLYSQEKNSVNHNTNARLFKELIELLWTDIIHYNNVLLFLTELKRKTSDRTNHVLVACGSCWVCAVQYLQCIYKTNMCNLSKNESYNCEWQKGLCKSTSPNFE